MNNNDNDIFAMILEKGNQTDTESMAQKINYPVSDLKTNHDEGKLAVDVAKDDKNLYIISTMSGAEAEKIEVFIHNDLLTVRGFRRNPLALEKNIEFFYSECFWGMFSRTIVLPLEVKGDLAKAKYQNGILQISIPIKKTETKIKIEVIDE
ncbi:MAG: Hsp20/alpha crystallin family protein [Patescibacteria group bacterium]